MNATKRLKARFKMMLVSLSWSLRQKTLIELETATKSVYKG